MTHLDELVDKLTDKELKQLIKAVGIHFEVDEENLAREDYENVIDEADREDFYRKYRKIISTRF